MKHLGDITKISGYTVPIVDCVIGGSPCQDLSVANGNRTGLDGERSGLYMEQIRIVKEMRERDAKSGRTDEYIRPRYMVWENVPGAFSSNKGEDFRIVLEELAKVADENATIPRPADGKWRTSGRIVADGWSIAWRILDSQFWGTSDKPLPQRRRRIALVADFGGQSASEILFVRQSVSGHTQPSEPKRKATATDAEASVGANDREGIPYTLKIRSGCEGGGKGELVQEDMSATVACNNDKYLFRSVGAFCPETGGNDSSRSIAYQEGVSPTLRAGFTPAMVYSDVRVVYALDRAAFNQGKNAQFAFEISDKGINSPLVAKGPGAVCYGIGNGQANQSISEEVVGTLNCMHEQQAILIQTKNRYIVRRLTPLECERLQGFPDGWTDIGEWTDSTGKKRQTSDAARYKALGNSIALPPWKWVLKRLCACYERDATMASLFDGIGGFPYLWEQLNGKGSCLWASEIEEFPIAVTKARIG